MLTGAGGYRSFFGKLKKDHVVLGLAKVFSLLNRTTYDPPPPLNLHAALDRECGTEIATKQHRPENKVRKHYQLDVLVKVRQHRIDTMAMSKLRNKRIIFTVNVLIVTDQLKALTRQHK